MEVRVMQQPLVHDAVMVIALISAVISDCNNKAETVYQNYKG
jgi:hypothetical protein